MTADRLSTTLSALADPTRRGILARLATGDATVSDLAEPYDMSLAGVSKHLKVLERPGLRSRGREAQWRTLHLEAAAVEARRRVRQRWARPARKRAGPGLGAWAGWAEPVGLRWGLPRRSRGLSR